MVKFSYLTEKRNVPSARSLVLNSKLLNTSLMYIRKSSGPMPDPGGTPAESDSQIELFTSKNTHYFFVF